MGFLIRLIEGLSWLTFSVGKNILAQDLIVPNLLSNGPWEKYLGCFSLKSVYLLYSQLHKYVYIYQAMDTSFNKANKVYAFPYDSDHDYMIY